MAARERKSPSTRPVLSAVAGMLVMTFLAVAAVGSIWLVAVPVGPEVCALTYPGPRNCFVSDRLAAAVFSTAVVGIAYAVALAVALTRRPPWVIGAGIVLLVTGIAAFVAAAWIPSLA